MPESSKAKKLVSVLAISTLVTGANKEAQVIQKVIALDRVSCIYYPV